MMKRVQRFVEDAQEKMRCDGVPAKLNRWARELPTCHAAAVASRHA